MQSPRYRPYAAYDTPLEHDPNFDPKNYKRCRGPCQILRPLRDYDPPKGKLCYNCRGYRRNPDGTVTPLKPIYPEPVAKPRRNAAVYPLDDHAGYKRYLREKAQARRDAKRAADGLPPRKPPAHGLRCRGECKRFLPRVAFTRMNRICDECLARELEQINSHSRSNNE